MKRSRIVEPIIISQSEGNIINRRFSSLPPTEHDAIESMADELANEIKNLGPTSAVQIIWAICRLIKRQR